MSKKIGFSYCPKVGGHNLLIGVALQCHQNQNVEHVESKQLGVEVVGNELLVGPPPGLT